MKGTQKVWENGEGRWRKGNNACLNPDCKRLLNAAMMRNARQNVGKTSCSMTNEMAVPQNQNKWHFLFHFSFQLKLPGL